MTDYHLYRWHCYDKNGEFIGFVERTVDGNPTKEDEEKALYRAQSQMSTRRAVRVGNRTYLG